LLGNFPRRRNQDGSKIATKRTHYLVLSALKIVRQSGSMSMRRTGLGIIRHLKPRVRIIFVFSLPARPLDKAIISGRQFVGTMPISAGVSQRQGPYLGFSSSEFDSHPNP